MHILVIRDCFNFLCENFRYVYGARSTAAKTRRCGECEGCNREDCGKCVTCLDKPKFGGKINVNHSVC